MTTLVRVCPATCGSLARGLCVIVTLFTTDWVVACDHCSCQEGSDCDSSGHAHSHDHSHGHDHGTSAGMSMKFTPVSLGASRAPSGPAAAGSGNSFRFGVVGDVQGTVFTPQLTLDMNNRNLDLAIYPGDLVQNGATTTGPDSWDAWIAATSPANFDLYMVPGNHDLPSGGDAQWQSKFNWLPDSQTVNGKTGIDQMDYFFDVDNTRFISVTTDSQANGAGGQPAALEWFTEVLNDPATQAKDHVFVYSHHPITFDQYDGTGGTYGDYWGAMVDSGAPVHGIFEGHWHQYQPGRPDPYNQQLWEVIAGTGNTGFSGHPWQNKIGYTVIEVDGSEVTGEFYGDSNNNGSYDNILDTFIIASATPRPTGLVVAYDFLDAGANLDSAHLSSPVGLRIDGAYRNGAQAVGGILQLDGANDFADAGGINDYDLAILRDLTISVRAKFDQLKTGDDANTLVSYTSDVAGYTNIDEIVNQPYNLRIRDDGKLEFMWEYANRQAMTFVSSLPIPANAGEWHEYAVIRDAETGEVRFLVDETQLGATLTFDELSELPTGGQQGYLRLGANWVTSESGFFDGSIDSLAIWNEVSTNFDLPLTGDLDGDDDIDTADWILYLTGLAVDLSAFTPEQRYAMGDLNFDSVNNFDDFVIFKNSYEQAHGLGTFETMLASVPEPTAFTLLGLAVAMPLMFRHRLRRGTSLRAAGQMVAIGVIALLGLPQSTHGADLNTNLVANPGFEDLGVLTEPEYGLSNILDWDGPGFAQDHTASGWANGAPLAGGENSYYAGGGHTISQTVALSTGATAATIAAGRGEFDLSAWFSGFSTQTDFATLSVAFLDGGGAQLGSSFSISTPNPSTWNQASTSSDIPLATDSATVTITSQGSGWADGYVDNVLFQVTQGDAPLGLHVNPSTGEVTIANPNTGGSIGFDFYEIVSPSGSLLASWNSFEDQGLDAIGSGVGQHWTEGAGVGPSNLTEVFLLGTSELSASESYSLPNTLNKLSTQQDLVFRYGLASEGTLHQGVVTYSGTPPTFAAGDFDADGDVDADDWNALRSNQHANLSGLSTLEAYGRGDMDGDRLNNHTDFVMFKTAFDSANGPGAFATMLASVPEPSTLTLLLFSSAAVVLRSRRLPTHY